jgi:hypothetical protein
MNLHLDPIPNQNPIINLNLEHELEYESVKNPIPNTNLVLNLDLITNSYLFTNPNEN